MGTEGAVAYCRFGGSGELLPLVRLGVGFMQPGDERWVETWDYAVVDTASDGSWLPPATLKRIGAWDYCDDVTTVNVTTVFGTEPLRKGVWHLWCRVGGIDLPWQVMFACSLSSESLSYPVLGQNVLSRLIGEFDAPRQRGRLIQDVRGARWAAVFRSWFPGVRER